MDGRFGLAFTAGMLATVNPCGFAMLPAYLAWFLGIETRRSEGDRPAADPDAERAGVIRAISVGAVVSLGFLVVFGAIGSVLSWLGVEAARISPWITIPIGIGLVAMGIAMLLGHEPRLSLPRLDRGGRERTFGSMFAFGVSYAIASVSCTAPVFLAQMTSGFGQGFATGVGVYLAYGIGMATVLIALTVAVSQARHSMVLRMKSLLPYVNRAAGGLLVLTGAYIAYYGWFEINDPGRTGDPFVDRVTGWSGDVAVLVHDLGALTVGLVLALLVVLAVLVTVRRSEGLGHDRSDPTDGPAVRNGRGPSDRVV
jgi:cytochrome c biogenesis protein CcdA